MNYLKTCLNKKSDDVVLQCGDEGKVRAKVQWFRADGRKLLKKAREHKDAFVFSGFFRQFSTISSEPLDFGSDIALVPALKYNINIKE